MKTLTTLFIFFCLITTSVFGQRSNLELSVKEKSNDANSKTERYHLLELKNNSSTSISVDLMSATKDCSGIEANKQTALIADFLDRSKRSELSSLRLSPNETIEFYIKIYRTTNTKLNYWNCTEITANVSSANLSSNTIVIKTFIPNPKDFN